MTRIAGWLNERTDEEAREALRKCCGADAWVDGVLGGRPFPSDDALFDLADQVWSTLEANDWREAFSHHPRIGERRLDRAEATEQSGMDTASDGTRQALIAGNHEYEERFGHVFLICATGKSAGEMLAALEARIGNEPEVELRIAAEEQRKIMRLRLEQLAE